MKKTRLKKRNTKNFKDIHDMKFLDLVTASSSASFDKNKSPLKPLQ